MMQGRERPEADLREVDLTALNPSLGRPLPLGHRCDCSWVGGLNVALEVVEITTERVSALELPTYWHNLPVMV